MPRRLLLSRPLWVAGAFLASALCFSVRQPLRQAEATPYTIRTDVEHPFDPDWPDVYLILATRCAGCHRPGNDRVNLTSYAEIIAARSYDDAPIVVPGNPDGSLLFEQVFWSDSASGDSEIPEEPSMPPEPHERLTEGQLQILRRWIANGALEYKLPETCSPRPLLEIDFPSARECRACHPKQFEEWSRSMHAYAQHSPVFEAFNLTLQERTGGTIGTFCSRCHTPLGTALGENGSRRNVNRSRLSMEGITCVVCHRIAKPYYKANTRMAKQPGKLLEGCMYGPFHDPVSAANKAHPAAGRRFLKTSAFCGACHDVTNPQGVRLEEAFSEWQNSPAAKQGVTCQHCHMGPIQGVPICDCERPLGRAAVVPGVEPERFPLRHLSDHTFSGPDYSLLPDTEFPEKLDWMYEIDYRDFNNLSDYHKRTLTALRRRNRRQLRIADAKRYELLQNAAKIEVDAPDIAEAGKRIKVHVDVISTLAGHNFPTGFSEERQAWVETTLYDPCGRPVFQSGDLDQNGDLRDGHSHGVEAGHVPLDRHLLNFQNKFIALTNKGTERSVVIPVNRHLAPLNVLRPAAGISASFGRPPVFRVAKGALPPLATIGRTYPMRLPDCPGEYCLQVRLNFRHLPPVLFDKVGIPQLKHLLEVVVIDEYQSIINVQPHD